MLFYKIPLIALLTIYSTLSLADENTDSVNEAIPVLEDKSADGWQTEFATFDYRIPCTKEKTPYTVIVLQGVNRMDLLSDDANGNLYYEGDISSIFTKLLEYCAAIAIPKSGISKVVTDDGITNTWRTWWFSEGVPNTEGIPIRNTKDEITEILKMVKLAKEHFNKSVYIVIGNDLGDLAVETVQYINSKGNISTLDGFISSNSHQGEFDLYNRYGELWESIKNTP